MFNIRRTFCHPTKATFGVGMNKTFAADRAVDQVPVTIKDLFNRPVPVWAELINTRGVCITATMWETLVKAISTPACMLETPGESIAYIRSLCNGITLLVEVMFRLGQWQMTNWLQKPTPFLYTKVAERGYPDFRTRIG